MNVLEIAYIALGILSATIVFGGSAWLAVLEARIRGDRGGGAARRSAHEPQRP